MPSHRRRHGAYDREVEAGAPGSRLHNRCGETPCGGHRHLDQHPGEPQTRRLVIAEEEVDVLDRLAGCAFPEIVQGADDDRSARQPVLCGAKSYGEPQVAAAFEAVESEVK